ncbi:MAG TPA: hypothetical protein VKY92_16730 [Verrucomicrobiae bacterium]|nr:hypothetical protein [Verrucomicrobiae bacterium]
MKRLLPILVCAGLVLALRVSAGDKPLTYYVQLIRCSEHDTSPEPGSRRVGRKLAEKFEGVFRCKSYWEISEQKVDVLPEKSARARLKNGRDVEIDLKEPGKRRVTTFHNGKVIDRTVEPLGEEMTLIGGDRDQTSHWFIVVRRDKPGA